MGFRKGHDGLAAFVKNELRKEPFTKAVFVFCAKRADRLKLLYWDGYGAGDGFKRLEETTFTWPTIRNGLMALNHALFGAPPETVDPEQYELSLEDIETALSAMRASPDGKGWPRSKRKTKLLIRLHRARPSLATHPSQKGD